MLWGKASTVTGLEITQHWLRVVELRLTSQGIFIERMGAHATPPDAVVRGYVVDAAAVGAAVRTLYELHDIKTRSAVVGIPASQAASRISRVPAVPPQQMRMLAQGELEHFRLLPQGEGTFDFVTLDDAAGVSNGGEEATTSILLMAMEEQAVSTYAQVVRAADLQLIALEPTSIASVRALYPYLLAQPATAFVVVGDESTVLSVVQNGALCYYRVLEGGVLRLGEVSGQVDDLVFELRRSLEFYHREMHPPERVSRIQLVLDTSQSKDLDRHLSDRLGMPVELRHPFAHVHFDPARFATDFVEEVGLSFTSAFGLALHDVDDATILRHLSGDGAAVAIPHPLPAIPRIDLSTREREKQLLRTSQGGLLVSLSVSALVALAFYLLSLWLNARPAQMQDTVRLVEADLTRVSQQIQQHKALVEQAEAATRKASEKGPAYSRILWQLSSAMPANVWMTSLGTETDGSLKVEGRATSTLLIASAMRRLSQLNLSPKPPQLVSIRREQVGEEKRTVFAFEIRLTDVSSAPRG